MSNGVKVGKNTFVDEPIVENWISWGPVMVGAIIALTIGIIMDFLGVGIGASLFSPNGNLADTLTIGTLFWLGITGIGSMYVGGWVASRFSRQNTITTGMIYGATVSSLCILIMLVVTLMSAQSLISNSLGALKQVTSMAGSLVSEGGAGIVKGLGLGLKEFKDEIPALKEVTEQIQRKAKGLQNISREAISSAEEGEVSAKSQLKEVVLDFLNSIENENYEEARKKLIDKIATLSGKSNDEINQTVNEWKQIYLEAKEKIRQTAVETGKKASKLISKIALMNAFLMILSMGAGIVGGINGARRSYLNS